MPDTTRAPATRFLHVANGSSTTNTIAAAAIPGMLSIWADPLHDGPVPAALTDDELLRLRARHLAEPGEAAYLETLNGLREWRGIIERHDAYDELVLWFEHDLFDQLNLLQLLSWLRASLAAEKTISLICIGSFPGRPRFKGLGELSPGELAPLLDARQPVSDAQYALAERGWQAFREPTPEALDELRLADTGALPFLQAALTRFLQEYPWTIDGLSRSERQLLRLADTGPIEVAAAFPRMHDDETAYYITDGALAALVHEMGATSPPLVTFDRGRELGEPLLRGSITITDAGRALLNGARGRVSAYGIDRWFGGVHLHSGGRMWRWDDARGRIAAS